VFLDRVNLDGIKLLILRVNNVSKNAVIQTVPQLEASIGIQLCADYYVDRDEDTEKIAEAIFQNLFGE
jgi:hypothetical protein